MGFKTGVRSGSSQAGWAAKVPSVFVWKTGIMVCVFCLNFHLPMKVDLVMQIERHGPKRTFEDETSSALIQILA